MTRTFLVLLLVALPAMGQQSRPALMQVRLVDGSSLNLSLLDGELPLQTPHGRLVIPLNDVRQVDFGPRLPEEVRRQIDAAIVELSDIDVAKRDSAGERLLKIGRHAFPAVVRVSKSTDRDLAITARQLREKFLEAFPNESLPTHDLDVIHTDESRIAGRIETVILRVSDPKFGEKTLRVTDLVSLRAAGSDESTEKLTAQPDPGSLTNFANQTGKSFLFQVTGAVNGTIYGSDIYTTDSMLATACVHAGLLQPGQSGLIRVTILPGQNQYAATTRHGITSNSWGAYPSSFKISSVRGAPK